MLLRHRLFRNATTNPHLLGRRQRLAFLACPTMHPGSRASCQNITLALCSPSSAHLPNHVLVQVLHNLLGGGHPVDAPAVVRRIGALAARPREGRQASVGGG